MQKHILMKYVGPHTLHRRWSRGHQLLGECHLHFEDNAVPGDVAGSMSAADRPVGHDLQVGDQVGPMHRVFRVHMAGNGAGQLRQLQCQVAMIFGLESWSRPPCSTRHCGHRAGGV